MKEASKQQWQQNATMPKDKKIVLNNTSRQNLGCYQPRTHLRVNVDHRWKEEGKRLSTSGGGNANHVTTLQGHRPSLRLDGSRLAEAALHDLRQNVLGHRGLLECHDRLRDVVSDDRDLLGCPPRISLGVGALGHIGMLDVKVLLERDQLLLGKVDAAKAGPHVVATAASCSVSTAPAIAASSAVA